MREYDFTGIKSSTENEYQNRWPAIVFAGAGDGDFLPFVLERRRKEKRLKFRRFG